MESFREKGSYYDVPADNIDFNMSEKSLSNDKYDPMLYMKKQKEFNRKDLGKMKSEKYKDSRYCD